MPNNFRSFGQSMGWTTGDIGIYKLIFGSPQDPAQGSSSSNHDNGTIPDAISKSFNAFDFSMFESASSRSMLSASDKEAELKRKIYLVSDGRPPEEYFRSTIFFYSVMLVFAVAFMIMQRRYYRSHPESTLAMKEKLREFQSLCVTAFLVAYYGLSTSALIILMVPTAESVDRVLAYIVLVGFSLLLFCFAFASLLLRFSWQHPFSLTLITKVGSQNMCWLCG